MIKKIICPTDFSDAANNATDYAAKMAQVLQAKIQFINIQTISPSAANVSMGEGIGAQAREYSHAAAERLKVLCGLVKETFNIEAEYEVDITTSSIVTTLSSFEEADEMIVMGTNGADGLFEFFFGTNTFHVIQKAKCPVLMVPVNTRYENIAKVVFAWNEKSVSKYSFSLLVGYLRTFRPEYFFLHVSKSENEKKEELFKNVKAEMGAMVGEHAGVEFKQVFSDDVPDGIRKYMQAIQAQILAITYSDRGVIGNLLHRKIVSQLSETAEFPILVLHDN